MSADVPKSWEDNPTTKDFIREWSQLEPKLSNVDLRAAIYLSRETMPIATYATGLFPAGREVLAVLAETKSTNSQTATERLGTLSLEDQMPVMEGLITHLRQTTDWVKQPKGFAGACLLARHSTDAAKIFKRFIGGLDLEGHKRPHWLNALLKNEQWYKDV